MVAAKHHIALPRIVAIGVGIGGADNEVINAIAIDISRAAHRTTGATPINAVEDKAIAAVKVGEIQVGVKALVAAKDHIAFPRGVVSIEGTDDEVIDAITIDIPYAVYRTTGAVKLINAVEDKAIATVEVGEVELCRKGHNDSLINERDDDRKVMMGRSLSFHA